MNQNVSQTPPFSTTTQKSSTQTTNEILSSKTWMENLGNVLRSPTFVFLTCVTVSFLLFFLRNPDPYFNPVFYGEDGANYVSSIYSEGFWSTLNGARLDYFVFGNIFLTWLGIQACDWLCGGNILQLPSILALVSYLFFALVVSLPVLLLRQRLGLSYRLSLWLASTFIPLGAHDNEVLGRICNVGYVFLYIAFVLILYRNQVEKSFRAILLTDLGLLACVTTNPLCLMLLPVTVWPYLKSWICERQPPTAILFQKSFVSLLMLGIGCLIVLLRIYSSQSPGYPPGELTPEKVVELALARNILFPMVHPFYQHLNLDRTIFIFFITCLFFYRFGDRKNLDIYLMGSFTLATVSYIYVKNRPTLLGCIADYTSTFPDRYYYAQNLIMLLLIIFLASDTAVKLRKSRWVKYLPVAFLAFYLMGADRQSSFGRPQLPLDMIGNFEDNVRMALEQQWHTDQQGREDPLGNYIRVQTYPLFPHDPNAWTMMIPRNIAESAVKRR